VARRVIVLRAVALASVRRRPPSAPPAAPAAGDDDASATVDERPTARDERPSRPSNRLSARRYQTGDIVGRGGMGEVVSARDRYIGREVAIKRLLSANPSERAIYRFLREARIQARLDHPAIVPVYDVGRDAHGRPYFTMKKVNGTTLAELLRSPAATAPDTRRRMLRAFVDVCLAVELAHTRGVVHRDLKPENLVLGDFGEVYVLDWGVAKIVDEGSDFADVNVYFGTAEGVMIGTPGFMSPEQIRGDIDLDGAADVYALGCVLFEILTGIPLHPSGRAGLASALAGIDTRPSSRVGDVPPELDELCVQATGERAARPSARELGERVQRFLDGDRDLSLRRRLAREHLERARVAFEHGEHEHARGIAMREAGRALALDPSLAGPADLLGRLMLEPPREMPREVEAAVEADAVVVNRRQARIGSFTFIAYLAFVPFLIGYRGSNLYAGGLTLYVLLNCVLMMQRAAGAASFLHGPTMVAIRNAVLIAAAACMFSPFHIAPGLAAVTTAALLHAPIFQRPRAVVILLSAMVSAILLPWFGELAGILPRTFELTADGAIIHTPALIGGVAMRTAAWIVFAAGLLASATTMGYLVRRGEREARRRLHLHAWHLRHLVPRESRAATEVPAG
jgi:serine/threonine-protein kinase